MARISILPQFIIGGGLGITKAALSERWGKQIRESKILALPVARHWLIGKICMRYTGVSKFNNPTVLVEIIDSEYVTGDYLEWYPERMCTYNCDRTVKNDNFIAVNLMRDPGPFTFHVEWRYTYDDPIQFKYTSWPDKDDAHACS